MGPSTPLHPDVVYYWGAAQVRLIEHGYDEFLVMRVEPHHFEWQQYDGTFDCNGVEANGCFDSITRIITWNDQMPWVILHEACHAIGYKNRWPEWSELGHEGFEWCN
jgi:hypothetical protein